MKDSYLEIFFIVTHRAGGQAGYADGDHTRLTNLVRFALLISFGLNSGRGKEIEELDNAHIICLMYKLISSSKDSEDLSIGLHWDITTQEIKLTNIKTAKGICHARFYWTDVFGFAEHQEIAKNEQKNDYKALFHRTAAVDVGNRTWSARVIWSEISWCIPHFAPNISQQKSTIEHIVSSAATELSYIKRSCCTKNVTTEKFRTFELLVQSGSDVPIYLIVCFMQRDQSNQQQRIDDTFHGPIVEMHNVS